MEKLSAVLDIPVIDLVKLTAYGIIDVKKSIKVLIYQDYQRLMRRKEHHVFQIIQALANHYKVPSAMVKTAVTLSRKSVSCCCAECGAAISKTQKKRNNGICDECASKDIVV